MSNGPYIPQPWNASDPVVVTSAMQAALTGYQPVDSDLTAIAALSTTSYGRNLLTLGNQAALQAAVVAAQTGTGSTFVMQASPTLTTPNIGSATATTIAASGAITVGPTGGSHLVVNTDSSIDTKYISQFLAQYGGYGAYFASTNRCVWASSTTNHASGRDLSIGRDSTNVLGVYTTASGATYGSLACANVTANGTVTAADFLATPVTFAGLPPASSKTGKSIQVSDRDYAIVTSNGTNWLRAGTSTVLT